jgi:hypothetical protein
MDRMKSPGVVVVAEADPHVELAELAGQLERYCPGSQAEYIRDLRRLLKRAKMTQPRRTESRP